MRILTRLVLSSAMIVAASSVSAGVIKQDGVVFTSSFSGNVLTLEIDAAMRSGGWAAATAVDALALKTIGSFDSVSMRSSNGTAWSLLPSELKASGCGAPKAGSATGMTRLCFSGPGIALADNMFFTFTFTGTPVLEAPHLKVHFVDASGAKIGSLLSLGFPAEGASTSTGGGQTNGTLAVDEDDAEVPEPRVLQLIGLGLAMLVLARRRRAAPITTSAIG